MLPTIHGPSTPMANDLYLLLQHHVNKHVISRQYNYTADYDASTYELDSFHVDYVYMGINGAAAIADTNIDLKERYHIVEPLSTVIAPKRALFKLAKTDRGYVVFTNRNESTIPLSVITALLFIVTGEGRYAEPLYKDTHYRPDADDVALINGIRRDYEANRLLETIKANINNLITIDNKDVLETTINNLKDDIDNKQRQLDNYMTDLRNAQLKYHQALYMTADITDEQIEFFVDFARNAMEHILVRPNYTKITFKNIMKFSEDATDYLKTALNSRRHPLHPSNGPLAVTIHKLIEGVNNRTLRIPIYATIAMYPQNITDGNSYIQSTGVLFAEPKSALVNAHVDMYNCFTTAKQMFKRHMIDGRYQAAYEQMHDAIGNVDVYDSPVMREMINRMMTLPQSYPMEIRTAEGWQPTTLGEFNKEVFNETD